MIGNDVSIRYNLANNHFLEISGNYFLNILIILFFHSEFGIFMIKLDVI